MFGRWEVIASGNAERAKEVEIGMTYSRGTSKGEASSFELAVSIGLGFSYMGVEGMVNVNFGYSKEYESSFS